jgi:hypothetical protein
MEAHLEGALRTAQGNRALRGREPVPGDEQQRLSVWFGEARERSENERALSWLVVVDSLAGDSLGEGSSSPGGAPLVGQHSAGHREQPRFGVLRYLVQATPGHEEGLGDRVVCLRGRASTKSVGRHGAEMRVEELREPAFLRC